MRCSGHVPLVGGPREDPGHAGRTMSLGWPGDDEVTRGRSGFPCCPHDEATLKYPLQQKKKQGNSCVHRGWKEVRREERRVEGAAFGDWG